MEDNTEIISEYNATDAMNDGTLTRLGTTRHLATVGALSTVMADHNTNEADAIILLTARVNAAAAKAAKTWEDGGIYKLDHNLQTATTTTAAYWLIPSELGGATIMQPSEY